MPIRNPFAKRPGVNEVDENVRPGNESRPTFEKVDTVGSKSSSAMSIKSAQILEPAEYKMSVVNDSGVYLPPSPPEKKGFWPRRSQPSDTSTTTRSSLAEIEPFSISRESFDSYRRSFDISARSPVLANDPNRNTRQSLDSRMPRIPRSAMNERRFERQPPTAEEGFEDVGLNDESKQPPPKKKGFFSKFGDSSEERSSSPSSSRFHIGGRKRGQSGVGEELGSMPPTSTPDAQGPADTKEDH
ncbi:hypothetical protein PVAG01_01520 [Phlyctema vagabunda]|uniref:Uncharacterized protein n=1 Tax=Phlyctema vagabunda TaxID=108571 RepID=A0ABR4PXE4_9HELO